VNETAYVWELMNTAEKELSNAGLPILAAIFALFQKSSGWLKISLRCLDLNVLFRLFYTICSWSIASTL
jgi:hypothetical protein